MQTFRYMIISMEISYRIISDYHRWQIDLLIRKYSICNIVLKYNHICGINIEIEASTNKPNLNEEQCIFENCFLYSFDVIS